MKQFHLTFSKLLESKLSLGDRMLNRTTCLEIYSSIFETLSELFKNTSMPLSNESANYVAQQYYDSVLINNTHELDPNIFTQRAKLENIETKELALLTMLFEGTDFRIPVMLEIKRRS